MKPWMLLGAILLGACTPFDLRPWSSREPVAGKSGPDWVIRCHMDDEGCLNQAREACPSGYRVLEKLERKMLRIHCDGKSAPLEYTVD